MSNKDYTNLIELKSKKYHIAVDFYKDVLVEARCIMSELNEIELTNDDENIQTIFRKFHILKGGFGFIGVHDIVLLLWTQEDILNNVRAGVIDLTDDIKQLIKESIEFTTTIINSLPDELDSVDVDRFGRDCGDLTIDRYANGTNLQDMLMKLQIVVKKPLMLNDTFDEKLNHLLRQRGVSVSDTEILDAITHLVQNK